MPRLLYIPRFDESGAGPRYRVYQYLDSFRDLGFEITVKPLFDIRYLNKLYFKNKRSFIYLVKAYFKRACYLIFNKHKFNLVLMDGELFPFIPFFIEMFFLPKSYLIDQDDAIFHTYDTHPSLIVKKLLGNKIEKVWRGSEHLITCNNYIKEAAERMRVKNIAVIPTVVDANIYKPCNLSTWKDKKETVIGWVGSPSTIKSIDDIKNVLIKIAQKEDIALYIIGAPYHLEGVKTVCIDWCTGWSEKEEIRLTNEIDIGIMPLLDVPYHHGKGGFKLIKYMACAKPMIATPIGINKEIVDHGKNGFLAATIDEWEKYLLLLIRNPLMRYQLGIAGREKMVASYSLQFTKPIMSNILLQTYNKAYHRSQKV